MKAGLDLARRFLAGELAPVDQLLEETDLPVEVAHAVELLAHDACHDLAIALAESFGVIELVVIVDQLGMPVHSGLLNPNLSLMLDANGVHTLEASCAYWSGRIDAACRHRVMAIEDLAVFSDPDEDQVVYVLDEFARVAQHLEQTLSPSSPLLAAPGL
ncbi:hypothetical protein [Geopseudomonas aromaticivorans]